MANIYDPAMLRASGWYVFNNTLTNQSTVSDGVLWFPVTEGTVLDISRPSANSSAFSAHWATTTSTPVNGIPTTVAAANVAPALALPQLTVPAGKAWCIIDLGTGIDPATFSLVIEDNIAAEPSPDPDPPVDPPAGPTATPEGQTVADYLGVGDDPALAVLCSQHAAVMIAMVRSYCRGKGFTADGPFEDVAAVITTATARMVANPEQSTIQAGEVSGRDRGFQGWNLAELAVLNRYRGRAA